MRVRAARELLMGWTAPRTWITGELIGAPALNTHIRDNLNYLAASCRCSLYFPTATNVTSGSFIPWAVELFDQDDVSGLPMHDFAVESWNITVQTAGTYRVTFTLLWDGSSDRISVEVRKNNSTLVQEYVHTKLTPASHPGVSNCINESLTVVCAAGDRIGLALADHFPGPGLAGTYTFTGTATTSFFELSRLGGVI